MNIHAWIEEYKISNFSESFHQIFMEGNYIAPKKKNTLTEKYYKNEYKIYLMLLVN